MPIVTVAIMVKGQVTDLVGTQLSAKIPQKR